MTSMSAPSCPTQSPRRQPLFDVTPQAFLVPKSYFHPNHFQNSPPSSTTLPSELSQTLDQDTQHPQKPTLPLSLTPSWKHRPLLPCSGQVELGPQISHKPLHLPASPCSSLGRPALVCPVVLTAHCVPLLALPFLPWHCSHFLPSPSLT